MRALRNFILLLAGASLLFSCEKEKEGIDMEVPEGYVEMTFTAVCEDSKTALNDSNTVWSEGDQIKVVLSDGSAVNASLTAGAGSTTGTFAGMVPSGKTANYAVYPAAAYSSVSGSTVNVSVSAEQAGTFAAGNIAVAKVAADHNMAFKNVNSFLVFQLKTGTDVTRVEVTSVDGGNLAATVPVSCSGDSPTPGNSFSGTQSATVSMTTSGAGTYYLSIIPGVTHAKGLLLKYYQGDDITGTYYFDRSLSIVRSRVYGFGEFEPEGEYYVTVSGKGKKNGVSWENAFSQDQMGSLLAAASSDVTEEKAAAMAAIKGATFHMGAGTYDFSDLVSLSFDEEESVSLSFIGGYPANPSGGAKPAPASNATNISGGDAHACFDFSGKMDIILSGVNITHGRVSGQPGAALTCSGSGLSLTMTDCRISDNVNPGSGGSNGGAGIFLNAVGEFSATRVTFADNTSHHAPALFCYSSDMTLNDCVFSGNTATNWGGAIRIRKGNPVCTFNDCSFSGNSATNDSGCIVLNDGTINFNNCSFTGNGCASNGGAIVANSACTINISGGSFKGNYVDGDGGEGGAIRLKSGDTTLNIENCTFGGTASGEANYSGMDGGALSLQVGTTTITNCDFIGNYALNDDPARTEPDKGYGGAIDCYSSASMTISGCSFSANKAWKGGAVNCSASGDISISGTSFTANGGSNARLGGAMRVNANIEFEDCTFGGASASDGNEALLGGALYFEGKTSSIAGCSFSHNQANITDNNFGGGAIFMRGGTNLEISSTSFTSNSTAACGGAICGWTKAEPGASSDNGTGSLTIGGNTTFSGNHADKWAGAVLYKLKGSLTVHDTSFTGNYSDQDTGALDLSNTATTFSFADVIFSGNHADGDNGGVMWLSDGNYSFSDCQFLNNYASGNGGAIYAEKAADISISGCTFEGNHTTCRQNIDDKKNGGALYIHGAATLRIKASQFNDNYAGIGGAIFTNKDEDNYPTVFLNACSFSGNYVQYRFGAAINIDHASYFCMNNSSFANNHYVNLTSGGDGLKASWIALDGIQNCSVISNCSLIGRTWRYNDGLEKVTTNNALIGLWDAKQTYLVNDLIILDTNGSSFSPLRGYNETPLQAVTAYYTHYSKDNLNIDWSGDHNTKGYWKEHTRYGSADQEAQWKNSCWKWDGYYVKNESTVDSYDKISKSDFTGYLNDACPAFVTWLGSDISKDQLGHDRGTVEWLPGAYQKEAGVAPVLLKVATWNIRAASMNDSGDRAWSARRAGVAALINDRQPDIICMQECEKEQREYLVDHCSGYDDIFDDTSLSWWERNVEGLENSSEVILYKTSAVSVQSSDTFWLVSGAPTSPSKSSDQNSFRTCTWMKCTYKGQKMLVLDVHLSYRTKNNATIESDEVIALRQKEMNVIKTWIDSHYNPSGDGWLLFMGDMNATHWEAIFDEWKDGTYGYFSRAGFSGDALGRTYNDFNYETGSVSTIDYQFYKGFPSVQSYSIIRDTYSDVEYLSDHWPVVVEYKM